MIIGIPCEIRPDETRVAISPQIIKKLVKQGLTVNIAEGAGIKAGFTDDSFKEAGAAIVDQNNALAADVVFKLHPPSEEEISKLKSGSLIISFLEPFSDAKTPEKLAAAGVNAIGMESLPRTSRAQSMDALSSQANIAGYRAVLEAASQLPRFFPLMMTSAGSAKPAAVAILGAGVAGLQAIATARRLGANVQAYDVRAEVKEQIESLGAKFIDLDLGEEGSGEGGYAKELSEEAKQRQQAQLQEKLKSFDVVITTANIPGRKAPVLVTEETVKGMPTGAVIVDMAAANGGNCELSEADQVVEKYGVKIIGYSNYPGLVAGDASKFYAQNLFNILALLLKTEDGQTEPVLNIDLEDDIIDGALVVHGGELRK